MGCLLRYPVTTVHLSGSLRALPVYRRRGWRLGLSRLLSLVLVGALRPFNNENERKKDKADNVTLQADDILCMNISVEIKKKK